MEILYGNRLERSDCLKSNQIVLIKYIFKSCSDIGTFKKDQF